jgi:hypothetical protein
MEQLNPRKGLNWAYFVCMCGAARRHEEPGRMTGMLILTKTAVDTICDLIVNAQVSERQDVEGTVL